MKIQDAIDFLGAWRKDLIQKGLRTSAAAAELGIEVLKRIEDIRVSPSSAADEPLPGETAD